MNILTHSRILINLKLDSIQNICFQNYCWNTRFGNKNELIKDINNKTVRCKYVVHEIW